VDICINRHKGDRESLLAYRHGDKDRDREAVCNHVLSQRGYGATLDETCVALGKEPNQISGRISELKKVSRLVATGATRLTRKGTPAKIYVGPEFLELAQSLAPDVQSLSSEMKHALVNVYKAGGAAVRHAYTGDRFGRFYVAERDSVKRQVEWSVSVPTAKALKVRGLLDITDSSGTNKLDFRPERFDITPQGAALALVLINKLSVPERATHNRRVVGGNPNRPTNFNASVAQIVRARAF
jgi:hypothetical protein